LDDWAASETGTATPKTRWRFQRYYNTFNLFKRSSAEIGPPLCDDCEKRFLGQSDTGSGTEYFSGWTEWKFLYSYNCRYDVDGDIWCQPYKVFTAVHIIGPGLIPGFFGSIPRWRLLRGKAYKDCDNTKPEECTHLTIATISGKFCVYFAVWVGTPAICTGLGTPPEIEDIPPFEDWTPTGTTGNYTSGSEWQFYPNRVLLGGAAGTIIATDFNLVRARTFLDLAESKLDITGATGNCGLILIPSKHDPDCCTIWNCDSTLACTGDPTITVEVSSGPTGCFFGQTLTDFVSATPSFEISGGNWELFDVA
jgi:hypothetical protein